MLDLSMASLKELKEALDNGATTSVELVCSCLNRIGFYDLTGICLNAVVVINPAAIEEAAQSDERRRTGAARGPLEGIPFTVKDSYKVQGLPVANGSPALADLVANADAASVALLRAAGAVLIGKTNMPPMAAGGIQPGLYGYAKSPYHPAYLTAAYGSGSSNGAAAGTAAGMAAFGLAEETLSSGRSPASNSALVAYTPSRGLISMRGNWPLFPTCDVVVPYARSVGDLLQLLDVLVVEDPETEGDFWRTQTAVELPPVRSVRPPTFVKDRPSSLLGWRLGVPRMFLGEDPEKINPVAVRPSVRTLWNDAANRLKSLGAELIGVDFPLVSNYESDRPGALGLVDRDLVHPDWFEVEMDLIMPKSWDDFLLANGQDGMKSLTQVQGDLMFPEAPDRVYANAGVALDFPRYVEFARAGLPDWADIPGFDKSLQGLEAARRTDLEMWLDELKLDALVFPANGDIASADIFERPELMEEALRNGVLFSNGNRAIRHLGVPTVTVPMGVLSDINMPVGMTIAGRAYSDDSLLDVAAAFENSGPARPRPVRTPPIPSDLLPTRDGQSATRTSTAMHQLHSSLRIEASDRAWHFDVKIASMSGLSGNTFARAWIDGLALDVVPTDHGWRATGTLARLRPRLHEWALLVVQIGDDRSVAAAVSKVQLPKSEGTSTGEERQSS